jgi:hypothetical protein
LPDRLKVGRRSLKAKILVRFQVRQQINLQLANFFDKMYSYAMKKTLIQLGLLVIIFVSIVFIYNKPKGQTGVVDDKDESVVLGNYYSKDSKFVYYKGHIINMADVATFISITPEKNINENCGIGYFKDINYVYFDGKVIDKADPNTFQPYFISVRNCPLVQYAVDKDNVFVNDSIMKMVDRETVQFVNWTTLSDENGFYMNGKPCVKQETIIENKELGYSIKLPKDWVIENGQRRDRITLCSTQVAYQKDFQIISGDLYKDNLRVKTRTLNLLDGGTIIEYFSSDPEVPGYMYEINFLDNQKLSLYPLNNQHRIEDFPFIYTIKSI